jgi:hypothetical protein
MERRYPQIRGIPFGSRLPRGDAALRKMAQF